jgi:hypothetical protein
MSYLRYLCLFSYSEVQHILCCVCVLFLFVLCMLLSYILMRSCKWRTCPFHVQNSKIVLKGLMNTQKNLRCFSCYLSTSKGCLSVLSYLP